MDQAARIATLEREVKSLRQEIGKLSDTFKKQRQMDMVRFGGEDNEQDIGQGIHDLKAGKVTGNQDAWIHADQIAAQQEKAKKAMMDKIRKNGAGAAADYDDNIYGEYQ